MFFILQKVIGGFILLNLVCFFTLCFTLMDESLKYIFRLYIAFPSIMIVFGIINLSVNFAINVYVMPNIKDGANIETVNTLKRYVNYSSLYFTIFFQLLDVSILLLFHLTALNITKHMTYIILTILLALLSIKFLFAILYKFIDDKQYLKDLRDNLYISNEIVSVSYNTVTIRESASSLSSSDCDENICLVCLESNLDVIKLILKCGHTICESCHDKWIQLSVINSGRVQIKCTLCDSPLEVLGIIDNSINKHYINPSKLKVLDV